MDYNKLTVRVLGLFLSTHAIAGSMGSEPNSHWSQVITLSVGPAWTQSNQTQTFYLQSDIEKTYSASKNTSTLFDGELFYGLQHSLNSVLIGQIGIAGAGTTSATLKGDIWEDADPDFNNYYYRYKINHAHIALKGKLLSDFSSILTPYVSASVGVGFNQSHGFTITPKIFEEVPAPGFVSHTQTAFTYTLGIGVQKQWNAHWQTGIGYEFADWGKSHLGQAPEQTLNTGLQLNHLYTNELQLSLSYII